MIISASNRFIICTPTKCGTEALRSALTRRSRVAAHVLPKHRVTVPEEFSATAEKQGWRRIMTVRNPWHRLVSMFYYLRNHNNGWGKGKYKATRFDDFLRYHQEMCVENPSVDWTWNLTEIFQAFGPSEIWKNENLSAEYTKFAAKIHGAPDYLTRVNVSRKDNDDYDSHYTDELLSLVHNWAWPDAKMFGYLPPET